MANEIRIIGMDLALNHVGFVELTDGELSGHWYATDIASSAAKSKKHGYRIHLPGKLKDKQQRSMIRLLTLHRLIEHILVKRKPTFVGIEDYAIRAEQGAHYLGEVGGVTRVLCMRHGIRFRLHDPISLKMFAAHDGTAQKDAIERAVKKRWGHDFGKYNPPLPKPTKRTLEPKQNRRTSEDLADAFVCAKLVWTEHLIRAGKLRVSDLEHPKEIQVFNRVTKSYPVNLLDREWLGGPC